MDLKKISLDEFLCAHNRTITATHPMAFDAEIVNIIISQGLVFKKQLDQHYAIYRINNMPGDIALNYNNNVVGYYYTDLLAIDEAHLDKKISTPLIIEAVEDRALPTERKLSCAGMAALERAWRVANGKATCRWHPL